MVLLFTEFNNAVLAADKATMRFDAISKIWVGSESLKNKYFTWLSLVIYNKETSVFMFIHDYIFKNMFGTMLISN